MFRRSGLDKDSHHSILVVFSSFKSISSIMNESQLIFLCIPIKINCSLFSQRKKKDEEFCQGAENKGDKLKQFNLPPPIWAGSSIQAAINRLTLFVR